MLLAGIPVDDRLVLALARGLHDADLVAATETLEDAYYCERRVVALPIADREVVLCVLEDGPDEFAELRGVLLREHAWRMDPGL